jgi:hypothetical protein
MKVRRAPNKALKQETTTLSRTVPSAISVSIDFNWLQQLGSEVV